MKRFGLILAFLLFLSGCTGTREAQDKLLQLRQSLSQGSYAFTANICADFGEHTYSFSLDCRFDAAGNMTFCVLSPDTISGITGKIEANEATLTFDDKSVAFLLLADGLVSPVSAPWLVVKGLRGGYLSSWRTEGEGILVCIDDTFEGENISFEILISAEILPRSAEIYWEGRRILSLTIENFRYL